MRFLVPLLLLPLIEIAGFAWVGAQVGALATVLLVILAGVLGILLIQRQGLEGVRQAQMGLQTGTALLRGAFDKLCLTFAGVLLLLPGFASDVLALILFIPAVRGALLARLTQFITVKAVNRRAKPGQAYAAAPILDGDFQDVESSEPTPPLDLPPADSKWRSPTGADKG